MVQINYIDAATQKQAVTVPDSQKAQFRDNYGAPDARQVHPKTFEDYTISQDCAASSAQPTGVSGAWQIIFEDNFDGTALSRYWMTPRGRPTMPDERPYNSTEAQAYKASRVSVSGGNLVLSAVRENVNAVDQWGGTTAKTYSSGMVHTCNTFTVSSGEQDAYIEARIQIPTDTGYWPAFWLTDPLQLDQGAEIDLAEFFPVNGSLQPHTFIHWGTYAYTSTIGQAGGPWTSAAPSNTWHTYGVRLRNIAGGQVRATAYFDGVQAYQVDSWNTPTGPLAMVLNLAVRQGATPANASMLVDYVRVWKLTGAQSNTSGSDTLRVALASAGTATTKRRDKYLQPFASTSIWNMPIGSGAVYLPLNMTAPTQGYGTDEEYLTFNPNGTFRRVLDRSPNWWPYDPAAATTDTGVQVRAAYDWTIPPPPDGAYPNRASAALRPDGLAQEFQYTVRPNPGDDFICSGGLRAATDLTGDGLVHGTVGGHGGSGLTGIGGTIRAGELTSTEPIRHALALTMNMRKWGTKQGGNITNGYRWPAVSADSYYNDATNGYGTITTNGGASKDGLGMGTLLAIPANIDLSTLGFETAAGLKLARAHQDYGAYVVDDSSDPGTWDNHRLNVEASVLNEFPDLTVWPGPTPFTRDMDRIFTRLAVVDNNTATSIGGGGTPRQPLAPPLA